MSASDDLRAFITPFLTGWRVQFGRWNDGGKQYRYAVIRPVGGIPASLVRRPQFTLSLIGAEGDATSVPFDAANEIVEATRLQVGDLVSIQAGEPVYMATDDGRPVFDIAISTIST